MSSTVFKTQSGQRQTNKEVYGEDRKEAVSESPVDLVDQSSGVRRPSAVWRMFGNVIFNHPRSLFCVMIAALMSNIFMILQPLFIMTVYDRVIPHGAFETLWALAIGVSIAFLLDFLMRMVRSRLENLVSLRLSIELQAKLYDALVHTPSQTTPKAVSVWTDTFREIERAAALVPAFLTSAIVDVPFIIAVLIIVYTIGGSVVFAPIAGILFLGIATYLAVLSITNISGKVVHSQQLRTELLSESATLTGLSKYIGAQTQLARKFQWLLSNSLGPTHRLRYQTDIQMQLTNLMIQGVIVGSVVLGVYRIADGEMSMGALVAVMLLVSRVLMPVGQFILILTRLNEISVPIDRIYNLFDLPRERSLGLKTKRSVEAGHISLSKAGLTFAGGSVPVLQEISLKISPGEKVAIIGRSGSGKTSLLKMLIRIYDVDQGSYLIDGYNASQYEPEEVRQSMSYMSQENELFDGNIFDNLMISRGNIEEQHVKEALVASGAFSFIRRSPYGLSQNVGKRGGLLSGGERQAVCLARTYLSDPKVYILDEPTSSMDQTMEGQVVAGFKRIGPDKTLIVATHRVTLLAAMDRVIWLDDGRIKADGPPSSVLNDLKKKAA